MENLVVSNTDKNILTIRLNREEKKNALNLAMYEHLATLFTEAESDPAVRVIVITGTGDSFCAGNDLQDFIKNSPTGDDNAIMDFLKALSGTTKPVVAAVNGTAVGIGVTMLFHCDFVYIDETSQLSLPFINLGLVPEAGSSLLLPHLAGHQKAAELLMLGEPFSAWTAKEIGLATALCTPETLHVTASKTAGKLAEKPGEALRQTKVLMRRDFESVAKRMEKEKDAFLKCLTSPQAKKRLAAFYKQRKP